MREAGGHNEVEGGRWGEGKELKGGTEAEKEGGRAEKLVEGVRMAPGWAALRTVQKSLHRESSCSRRATEP